MRACYGRLNAEPEEQAEPEPTRRCVNVKTGAAVLACVLASIERCLQQYVTKITSLKLAHGEEGHENRGPTRDSLYKRMVMHASFLTSHTLVHAGGKLARSRGACIHRVPTHWKLLRHSHAEPGEGLQIPHECNERGSALALTLPVPLSHAHASLGFVSESCSLACIREPGHLLWGASLNCHLRSTHSHEPSSASSRTG